MKIDGRCHCGLITYEADLDADKIMICHCTDCQTLSGSAFRIVAFTREGAFRLLSGTPKIYVKTAESGSKRSQAFCPECGTPIFSAPVGGGAKVHSIRVGTIRQRDQLLPKTQIWLRSSQTWLTELGCVPSLETQPVFGQSGGVT